MSLAELYATAHPNKNPPSPAVSCTKGQHIGLFHSPGLEAKTPRLSDGTRRCPTCGFILWRKPPLLIDPPLLRGLGLGAFAMHLKKLKGVTI